MKAIHHLIVAICFFILLLFVNLVLFKIATESPMVILSVFLGCVGGFNLGAAYVKYEHEL